MNRHSDCNSETTLTKQVIEPVQSATWMQRILNVLRVGSRVVPLLLHLTVVYLVVFIALFQS